MRQCIQFIIAVTVLSGCAHQEQVESNVHLNTADDTLTLIASRPGLTAVGSDYFFVGPVSIWHSRGTRHYLWLGLGSSIDRELTGATLPRVTKVTLLIDDMPMTLDVKPWAKIAGSSPYAVEVPLHHAYGTRITLSQLDKIAHATNVAAELSGTHGRLTSYAIVHTDVIDWSNVGVASSD